MSSQVLPRCQCCQGVPDEGLYDGIRIQGILFCSDCCHQMTLSPIDSFFYQRFLSGVKKALFPMKC